VNEQRKEVSLHSGRMGGPIMPGRWFSVLLLVPLIYAAVALPAFAADGQYIAHNTPAYVSSARDLGPEDSSNAIEVSIWLQPHNRSAIDTLAHDLYDFKSTFYRQWLKSSEVAARFAPTAAEAKTVQEFFESNKLKVIRVGPHNFYVRARGTVTNVEKAFHVQLNNYQVGDRILRANAGDPYIEGPAAALAQVVSGLDSGAFEHPLDLQPTSLGSSSSSNPSSVRPDLSRAASAADSSFFDTVCFTGAETLRYGSGSYPNAVYRGNGYSSGSLGCGYSPANVYAAYNLNGLYAEGYKGAGQTIAIIDWCGSPTIRPDANAFSQRFGLPALTAANFTILNYPAPSACSSVDLEINLDVEWTHAIAPKANIDLVVPPSSDYEDVDEAVYYAATAGLGNVISGSYTSPEIFVSGAELNKENLISEIASVMGVATNFASGDTGGSGGPFTPATVSVPADLPYATGVGGVSLALTAHNAIAFQTGWETYRSILNNEGIIYDPPISEGGFVGGSGGGASAFFAKPSFQAGLPGKYRQVPDVSWLADPLTGAVVLISQPGQLPLQIWYAVGGTSLSTPMFSALWAIANEEAGTALGQAAAYLYSMPPATITDIVPYSSPHNVTAVIEQSSSVTHSYDPAETLEVIPGLFGPFYSAIWNTLTGEQLTVSFGEDYHLKTKSGWDDVTGVGTPKAKAFADWFAPPGSKK
jgi:subtilase family serine protease